MLLTSAVMSISRLLKHTSIANMDTRVKRDQELEGLSSLGYYERLTQFARGSTRLCVENSVTVIDFRSLYAINVHHLQRQLAQEIRALQDTVTSERQLSTFQELLEQYSTSDI
jgi:hypothetical protein